MDTENNQHLSHELIALLDSSYIYLDLEVSMEGILYQIGFIGGSQIRNYQKDNLSDAYTVLAALKKADIAICGHNFRRFDYPYLLKEREDFHSWQVIDTLELSLLAFPLETSHKLQKDYKSSEFSGNNPLEDAYATRVRLFDMLNSLLEKPESLRRFYVWLLTCGKDDASLAYWFLFMQIPAFRLTSVPALSDLPESAISGFDPGFIDNLLSNAPQQSFDVRLSLAALLAWNYERNIKGVDQFYSSWLNHLPEFNKVISGLQPLTIDPTKCQSYLEHFGISSFRGIQEEAVQAVLKGERPLVVMATGGGKSLCYQLPALMLADQCKALTVVISPLQALMEDQVSDIEETGLSFATFINGNITAAERQHRLQQLRSGTKRLLYISPEQLRSMSIRSLLEDQLPALWVIDEAHCVSQWGHDFRPDYRFIPKFIQQLYEDRGLPMPLLALMTATATLGVQEDIKKLFAPYGLEIGKIFNGPIDRENLALEVVNANGNKDSVLLEKVRRAMREPGSVLIYTTTRKKAEQLATMMNREGIKCEAYHGKIDKEKKQEILEQFKRGDLNLVSATCAFGMGINRKDVRSVIHYSMSANLEGYTQEAGRAGRDGLPSSCTLLYDLKDTDTIFYLQSQNQLRDQDLRNIFTTTRGLRNRLYGKDQVSEDWFWATANEILNESNMPLDFSSEPDQSDTKIKVALHHLENFGLVERGENLSTFIKFELRFRTPQESLQQFENYSRANNLPVEQTEKFNRLIHAMHLADKYNRVRSEPFPLEQLSDEAGIAIKELTQRIRELQRAEVCSVEIPVTILVTKGVSGDARRSYDRIRLLEDQFLNLLEEIYEGQNEIQINLRGVAARLDPDGKQNVRSSTLMSLAQGWADRRWVRMRRIKRDTVVLSDMHAEEHIVEHRSIAEAILTILYRALGDKNGARLPVKYELNRLAREIEQETKLRCNDRDLSAILLWLHQRRLIRLTEGLNLFQQALRIRVIKGANIRTINRRYPEIRAFYEEQTRRTHVMVEYGRKKDPEARRQMIRDYFGQSQESFSLKYPELSGEAARLPVIQDEYSQILDVLNGPQREVVLADEPAMAVIAGPGSGKTRTIVHRIAYLVKVKRVDPDRILALAYNRNAVREMRLRLKELIGPIASRLRVFTFHGLALALLGRTVGQENRGRQIDFTGILEQACTLLESGDELDDQDSQVRRNELLGDLEYIFVDEYQDVAEAEYRLIKLTAGLGESEDETRPVQINLCVIADDDQNIYEFRGTSVKYIMRFADEYKARTFMLTENYRSSEPIISVANRLISNNKDRRKQAPEEQVRIDDQRKGQGGAPVEVLKFRSDGAQSSWISQRVQKWIQEGVPPREIAILSRTWDQLGPIRLLLEREGIKTQALRGDDIKLTRNFITRQLIDYLKENSHIILPSNESVEGWLTRFLIDNNRYPSEPTARQLLEIAKTLDQERGLGAEEIALPISADELLTAIFEFSESKDVMIDDNAVLVTSCHGAKGLEFRKVILLTDGYSAGSQLEAERRLFYVAITRAKEELALCAVGLNQLLMETEILPMPMIVQGVTLPDQMYYEDFDPRSVNLGHYATRNQQSLIKTLHEDETLYLKANKWNGWDLTTQKGVVIGALSKAANLRLAQKGMEAGRFDFKPGEVKVRNLYHHLKVNEITDVIEEDWFVVIPYIRLCR